MKIVATSDIHGNLPDIPDCDLAIIAGDISPLAFQAEKTIMRAWLNSEFTTWLNNINAPTIGIAGNHDFCFSRPDGKTYEATNPNALPWIYLEDSTTVINGLVIHGTPRTPKYGKWSFQATDEALEAFWRYIPPSTNILVVHGPPHKVMDKTLKEELNVGSKTLLEKIRTLTELKLVIFGHIHEGFGSAKVRGLTGVQFYNVSHCDITMQPNNPIVEIEI